MVLEPLCPPLKFLLALYGARALGVKVTIEGIFEIGSSPVMIVMNAS